MLILQYFIFAYFLRIVSLFQNHCFTMFILNVNKVIQMMQYTLLNGSEFKQSVVQYLH